MARKRKLTEQQNEAARMLATGSRPSDVAKALNVRLATISEWKRETAFRAAVEAMSKTADERAIETATKLRERAALAGLEVVDKLLERLRHGACDECGAEAPPDGREAAAISNALLGWYKTTSGQTGIVETTRQEHTGDLATTARALLRAELRELSDEELSDGDDTE